MAKGIFYALTAGFLGAVAWAGLTYALYQEIAFLSILTGLGVGFAMHHGAAPKTNSWTGLIAGVIMILSFMGGKYAAIELVFEYFYSDASWEQERQRANEDEAYAKTYMAEVIVREYTTEGKPVYYPPEASRDHPESGKDYPANVWEEATARWQDMTPAEHEAFLDQEFSLNKAYFESKSDDLIKEGFLRSISTMQIIMLAIGCFIAFKIASDQDDAQPTFEAPN